MDRLSQARRRFAVTGHSIYFDLANQNPTPRPVLEELVRFHREAHRRGPDKDLPRPRRSVAFTVRRDAIRFGLGLYNRAAEVDRVLAVLKEASA